MSASALRDVQEALNKITKDISQKEYERDRKQKFKFETRASIITKLQQAN
jgi:hypothetical protein